MRGSWADIVFSPQLFNGDDSNYITGDFNGMKNGWISGILDLEQSESDNEADEAQKFVDQTIKNTKQKSKF